MLRNSNLKKKKKEKKKKRKKCYVMLVLIHSKVCYQPMDLFLERHTKDFDEPLNPWKNSDASDVEKAYFANCPSSHV